MSMPRKIKRNERVFDLHEKGWSYNRIARKYNMTPTRVGAIVRDETKRRNAPVSCGIEQAATA